MRALLFVLVFAIAPTHARLTDRCDVDYGNGVVEVFMNDAETTDSLREFLEADSSGPRQDVFYRLWEPKSITWWPEYATLLLWFDVAQDTAQIAASVAADPVLENLGVWDTARETFSGFCGGVPMGTWPITLFEFFSPQANRYLISTSEAENSALAKGNVMRWQRTGEIFRTMDIHDCHDARAVYRFHHRKSNTQYFAQDGEECGALRRDPGWAYRGRQFGASHPVAGVCPAKTTPMYLLQERRGSVKRYVWRDELRDKLTRSGWSVVDLAMCLVPDYTLRRYR